MDGENREKKRRREVEIKQARSGSAGYFSLFSVYLLQLLYVHMYNIILGIIFMNAFFLCGV